MSNKKIFFHQTGLLMRLPSLPHADNLQLYNVHEFLINIYNLQPVIVSSDKVTATAVLLGTQHLV